MNNKVLLGLLLLVSVMFFGCAVPDNNIVSPIVSPEVVYYPKLPQGVTTIDAAEKELANLLMSPYKRITYYASQRFPTYQSWMNFVDTNDVDKRLWVLRQTYMEDDSRILTLGVEGIKVSGGILRIPVFPLAFEELAGFPIKAKGHEIDLPKITLGLSIGDPVERVADLLFFIQQSFVSDSKKKLDEFEKKAGEYRGSQTKPKMGEEQRKLIVQANAFNQQKNYGNAIEKYLKAVELDPTSYPAAYHNLALLYAQQNKLWRAIFYMKHYLLLEPDSSDARSAQDKIYEWEGELEGR